MEALHVNDMIDVYLRSPYKLHRGSPMRVIMVCRKRGRLDYVIAEDRNGMICELYNRTFQLKLNKHAGIKQDVKD